MIVDLSKFFGSKIERILQGRGYTYQAKLTLLFYLLEHPEEADPNYLAKKFGTRRPGYIHDLFDDMERNGFFRKKSGGYDLSALIAALSPTRARTTLSLSEEEEHSLRRECGSDYLRAYNSAESYVLSLQADGKRVRATGYTLILKAYHGRWWEKEAGCRKKRDDVPVPKNDYYTQQGDYDDDGITILDCGVSDEADEADEADEDEINDLYQWMDESGYIDTLPNGVVRMYTGRDWVACGSRPKAHSFLAENFESFKQFRSENDF